MSDCGPDCHARGVVFRRLKKPFRVVTITQRRHLRAWVEIMPGSGLFWVHRTQVGEKFTTKTRICVPTKRNKRETNHDAFQKNLYHRVHQTIRRKKMFFAKDARVLSTILAHLPWSLASSVVWDVLRPSPAFAYAARIAPMILRTARSLYAYFTQKFALTRRGHGGVGFSKSA